MNESPRNSLKKGGRDRAAVDGPSDLPDKLYFKIGEVSELAGVESHVLRFWESEFKEIRPQRAASRQRLYRRVDVETILKIKKLLYVDGYTVPGARKFLTAARKQQKEKEPTSLVGTPDRDFFSSVKSELVELKKLLDE